MKIISLKVHGALDYVTVIAFAILPTLVGLHALPEYVCYALSAVHLSMTVLTKFPLGILKIIPIGLHKIVETVVGPVLLVLPWVLGFSGELAARYVFVAAGVVILLVGLLSDYAEGTH